MENFENIRMPWPDWKIVKYLGGGAYGKVYEIERNNSGIREKAAVKIVSRPKEESELEADYQNGYDRESIAVKYTEILQEYINEYKLMKELQGQSNIVSCDDFAIEKNPDGIGGKIYIRMELLTPLQKVTKERLLSEEEVIKLGKDICKALILCESRNIIHRDIKPDNVMISKFGDFKLGDFGVSKVMGHTTAGTMTGTEGYIAPEVLHMEKYGKEVDIYSLGIVMYWLLNNRKMPFIGADEKLTPSKVSEASLRRYHGDKIPAPKNGSARLKQIVLKACEYYPKDRFLTAQEMYDALIELKDEKAPLQSIQEEAARNKKMGADSTFGETPRDVGGHTEENSWDVNGKTLGNSWGDTAETIGKPKQKIERQSNASQSVFQHSEVKNGFKVTMQDNFSKPKKIEKQSDTGQSVFQHSEVKNGFKVTMQDNFSMQEPEDFSSETIGIKNVKSKEKKVYSESDEQCKTGENSWSDDTVTIGKTPGRTPKKDTSNFQDEPEEKTESVKDAYQRQEEKERTTVMADVPVQAKKKPVEKSDDKSKIAKYKWGKVLAVVAVCTVCICGVLLVKNVLDGARTPIVDYSNYKEDTDDNGNVSRKYYYYNGNIARVEERDTNGTIRKETDYREDGTIQFLWEYNESGAWTKDEYYDESGKLDHIREYNENGNEFKTTYYYYDENDKITSTSEYDENGNKIETTYHYDENDKITSTSESEYDENGNKIKTTYYDESGNVLE